MPPIEILPLGEKPIGAGGRQPGQGADGRRRQPDTIRHLGLAVRIVSAAAALAIEERAADIGVEELACILVLELHEAAAAAAVAEAFPFLVAHGLQGLRLPELYRLVHGGLRNNCQGYLGFSRNPADGPSTPGLRRFKG